MPTISLVNGETAYIDADDVRGPWVVNLPAAAGNNERVSIQGMTLSLTDITVNSDGTQEIEAFPNDPAAIQSVYRISSGLTSYVMNRGRGASGIWTQTVISDPVPSYSEEAGSGPLTTETFVLV